MEPANFRPFAPHGWHGVAESCALLFFAYTGYARLATLGEEVRDFGKPWIARLLTVGAATAMLGDLLSQILGINRMMLSMARHGDLPRFLNRIDETPGVPSRAIVLTGTIAATLTIAGSLDAVIAAAAFTILIYYALTNLAAIRLPGAQRLYPRWSAWAGLVTCIAMALSLQPRTILAGIALLAVGFTFRFCLHRLAPAREDDIQATPCKRHTATRPELVGKEADFSNGGSAKTGFSAPHHENQMHYLLRHVRTSSHRRIGRQRGDGTDTTTTG